MRAQFTAFFLVYSVFYRSKDQVATLDFATFFKNFCKLLNGNLRVSTKFIADSIMQFDEPGRLF